ncbi:hypothetical protein [Sulfurihydrogenibium subterraneum]|uniref:hypothetical protein n=1 Tax=Sulfurihydrogenibium subterraneum TaxID=171121 RepID=UPI00048B7C36|nr:hypothetical protein [Sulfurihydrogenibium subterraneum]
MKTLKILLAFILVISFKALSQEDPVYTEVKLLEKILLDITQKQAVYICIYDSEKVQYIQKYSTKIHITNCQNADIILSNREIPYSNKPVIALNEEILKQLQNAIGGLYWKKGRPQLIFLEDRLKKFDIQLPSEYDRFIIKSRNLSQRLIHNINDRISLIAER